MAVGFDDRGRREAGEVFEGVDVLGVVAEEVSSVG
jgi:hypothetical protein